MLIPYFRASRPSLPAGLTLMNLSWGLLGSGCVFLMHPAMTAAVVAATSPQPSPPGVTASAELTIASHYPSIIIPVPSREADYRRVVLDFVAAGEDWGAVYLNGRAVFRAYNHNRRQSISLPPGAYYLEFTGVVQSDCWARGYLDVGRDDTNVLVITFSKQGGVRVSGDPYAWIPDDGAEPSDRGICANYSHRGVS